MTSAVDGVRMGVVVVEAAVCCGTGVAAGSV
jgi:hypothetical protein